MCSLTSGAVIRPLHEYIAVIQVDNHGATFTILTAPELVVKIVTRREIPELKPHDNWIEQDANEIMQAIYESCSDACKQFPGQLWQIISLGVTNERETVVAWNSCNGKPLYNAICANDSRCKFTIEEITKKLSKFQVNHLQEICGSLISTPDSLAPKVNWLLQNVKKVSDACNRKCLMVGSLDSWIIWNLTKGGIHATDITNGAHSKLMDIRTLAWDAELLKTFCIPKYVLPKLQCSSIFYGFVTNERLKINRVPIIGVLTTFHAALSGQMATTRGHIYCFYGKSNLRIFRNTGLKTELSKFPRNFKTTISTKWNKFAPTNYGLEANIPDYTSAVDWLQHKLRIANNLKELEHLANKVDSTDGLYFVPAFKGLSAPYWQKNTRSVMCGIHHNTTKMHIARAALEAIGFQCQDMINLLFANAQPQDGPKLIYADGELAQLNILLQLQADISGLTVLRCGNENFIAVGVAMFSLPFNNMEFEKENYREGYSCFVPKTIKEERYLRYEKWMEAVKLCCIYRKKEMLPLTSKIISSLCTSNFEIGKKYSLMDAANNVAQILRLRPGFKNNDIVEDEKIELKEDQICDMSMKENLTAIDLGVLRYKENDDNDIRVSEKRISFLKFSRKQMLIVSTFGIASLLVIYAIFLD